MYLVRIWKSEGHHYIYGEEQTFSNHDEAWKECCRLLNQGIMCDIIKKY